jgi:hypothetical protein
MMKAEVEPDSNFLLLKVMQILWESLLEERCDECGTPFVKADDYAEPPNNRMINILYDPIHISFTCRTCNNTYDYELALDDAGRLEAALAIVDEARRRTEESLSIPTLAPLDRGWTVDTILPRDWAANVILAKWAAERKEEKS